MAGLHHIVGGAIGVVLGLLIIVMLGTGLVLFLKGLADLLIPSRRRRLTATSSADRGRTAGQSRRERRAHGRSSSARKK